MNQRLLLLLRGITSAAIMLSLFYFLDLSSIAEEISSAQKLPLFLATLLILMQNLIVAIRWNVVLGLMAIKMRPKTVCHLTLVGAFFSQILPSSVGGDMVRVYGIKKLGFTVIEGFESVLIERVIGLMALILLIVVMLPIHTIELISNVFPIASLVQFMVFSCLILLIGLVAAFLFRKKRQTSFFGRLISDLASNLRTVWLSPKLLFFCIIIGLLGYCFLTISFHLVCYAFSIDFTFINALSIIPLVFFLLAIPISIAGWGVREGSLILLMKNVGVPFLDAAAASLTFGFLFLISTTPGLVLWVKKGFEQEEDN